MSELPTPSEIRARQEERAVAHELPPTPNGWALVQRTADGGMYRRLLTGQTVILSWSREDDGRVWAHLSTSMGYRIPRWEELRDAKEAFLGDVKAIQVLPDRAHYVNLNPHVLHLFACEDGDPLPEFSWGGTL